MILAFEIAEISCWAWDCVWSRTFGLEIGEFDFSVAVVISVRSVDCHLVLIAVVVAGVD